MRRRRAPSVRRGLDLERNINTLLSGAFALAIVGDVAEAQKSVDEAKRLPLASSNDAQTVFRLVDAVIKLRRGDRAALDALPPMTDDNDNGVRFTTGFVNLAARQRGCGRAAVQADSRSPRHRRSRRPGRWCRSSTAARWRNWGRSTRAGRPTTILRDHEGRRRRPADPGRRAKRIPQRWAGLRACRPRSLACRPPGPEVTLERSFGVLRVFWSS